MLEIIPIIMAIAISTPRRPTKNIGEKDNAGMLPKNVLRAGIV